MTSLDRFRVVFHAPEHECAECDHSGDMFAFWTRHSDAPETSPDYTVCIDCLFEMEGRFKNQPPATVLRKFEEITSITVNEKRVEIGTRSQFGYYFHVHYTQPELRNVTDTFDETSSIVESCIRLTGESEIFCESGEHAANQSPYAQLARRALGKHNQQESSL